MVIYPESFSVKPNTEATVGLRNLFKTTAQSAINKNLTLMKGNYVFCSKNAESRFMHISNSMARDEYPKGAAPNMHKAAIIIENIKNMDIDCSDSTFIIDGKMTHIYINNCENIKIKNLSIQTAFPNVHKITIIKASPFYVTFEVDSQSKFVEENGGFYWVGTDYRLGFTDSKNGISHTPTAKKENLFHIKRNTGHPLFGVASLKQISQRTFNARYIVPKDFEEGQVFYIYPAHRDEVGIFIENSKNIQLSGIRQTFNNSMALVAQNSENISLDGLDFSPNADSEVDFCSFGDFLHFSMCRGKISVTNSNFDSAGDSVCRLHGLHFKIVEANKDKMLVKFPNPRCYGFDCLREGDVIAFIDPKTLSEVGRTKLLHATPKDEYYYELVLTSYEPPMGVGGFIECIPANPSFEFCGNTINRVAQNGVICNTRGKIRIENNRFLNTGETGVLVANDTSADYISGCICDMAVTGNAFMNCENSAISIKPEVRKPTAQIHKNILIENNLFVLNNIHAVEALSCEKVTMQNNVYKGRALNGKWIVSKNSEDFETDCPK